MAFSSGTTNQVVSEMTLTEIVDLMVRQPAPVLCLDTCSLLDVWRTLLRIDVQVLDSAQSVDTAIVTTPPQLWSVIVDQVQVEWDRNLPTVRQEAGTRLRELETALKRVHDVVERMPTLTRPNHTSLNSFLLDPFLEGLTKSIFSHSVRLELNESAGAKALKRNLSRCAPAEQGGSIEDCVIIEHYLGLASALKAREFANPVIFVSSNSNDYGKPGKLLGSLQAEFDGAGLQFAVHLAHARSIARW